MALAASTKKTLLFHYAAKSQRPAAKKTSSKCNFFHISPYKYYRMDRSQYNQCVEQYADRLFRFAFSSLRNRERAEDVVQESFARVWEKVESIDFAKAKSYLFTVAHHAMIDEVRQRQRFTDIEACSPNELKEVSTPYPDVNDILHKALAGLPEMQRNAVLLRDYEGYSYQEIGNITGMSEAQVKINIFRARTALKNKLKSIDNLIDIEP